MCVATDGVTNLSRLHIHRIHQLKQPELTLDRHPWWARGPHESLGPDWTGRPLEPSGTWSTHWAGWSGWAGLAWNPRSSLLSLGPRRATWTLRAPHESCPSCGIVARANDIDTIRWCWLASWSVNLDWEGLMINTLAKNVGEVVALFVYLEEKDAQIHIDRILTLIPLRPPKEENVDILRKKDRKSEEKYNRGNHNRHKSINV